MTRCKSQLETKVDLTADKSMVQMKTGATDKPQTQEETHRGVQRDTITPRVKLWGIFIRYMDSRSVKADNPTA